MKKLLILFIACMAVLTGTAQAAELEQTKDKLTAFGLIDQDFNEENPITRAEFADIIARFFPNDPYDYGSENTFRDVSQDHELASSINKAAAYGIMGGVGSGMFAPEDEISSEQMQVALVRVLGYNMKAEMKGGYRDGYAQVAADLRLTSGISASTSNAAAALIMVNNALDIYVTEENLSTNEVTVSTAKTLMNSALHIYKESGVLNGAGMKAIDEKYQNNSDSVVVGERRMDAKKISDYSDLVGRFVDAYYHSDDSDEASIVWCGVRKTTEKTVNLRDMVKIENNIVTYYEVAADGKKTKKTLRLAELPYVIYNNRPETSIPAYGDNGSITFIDTGSGYDVVEIKDYITYVVENASETQNTISTKLDSGAFKLDDYEYVNIINSDKTSLALKKLVTDDIISVLISLDHSSIEIIKSEGTLSGKIEKIDFNDKEITIGDTVYPFTTQFKTKLEIYSLSALYAYSGNFKTDVMGNVAYFDMEADGSRRIGYLIKMYLNDEEDDTRPTVRILNDTGDIKDLRMRVKDDQIVVDGEKVSAADFKNRHTSSSGVFDGLIITYAQNSKGEVVDLECAAQSPRNGLYQFASVTEARYRRSALSFYNDVIIKDKAVIFHVPQEEAYKGDSRCYALLTTGSFNDNSKYKNIKFYALEEDALTADAVVCEWSIEGDSANAYPMMIGDISYGINEDNEEVEFVSGEMYSGTFSVQSMPGETLQKTTQSIKGTIEETAVSKGDIVLCNSNFFGSASAAKLIYDCSEDVYYQDNPYMLNDYQLTYALGTVEQRDGKTVKLKLANSSKYQYYNISTDKIYTINEAGSAKPYIEKGTINDIRTVQSYGADASRVFIHASYNQPVFIVIYNR